MPERVVPHLELIIPFSEVFLELFVVLLVLVVVKRGLEHVIALVVSVALLVENHVSIALEVVVPQVLGHLGPLRAAQLGEVASARESC